ncbi:hypothetical protein NMG60_11028817 [Bertholletia excelsa]
MEGLIPLVYRTLKKRKKRRQYQCLSSTSGCSPTSSYNNFHSHPQTHPNIFHAQANGHRRHNSSLGEYYSSINGKEFSFSDDDGDRDTKANAKPKHQIVRFSSHRRLFSCVTGDI